MQTKEAATLNKMIQSFEKHVHSDSVSRIIQLENGYHAVLRSGAGVGRENLGQTHNSASKHSVGVLQWHFMDFSMLLLVRNGLRLTNCFLLQATKWLKFFETRYTTHSCNLSHTYTSGFFLENVFTSHKSVRISIFCLLVMSCKVQFHMVIPRRSFHSSVLRREFISVVMQRFVMTNVLVQYQTWNKNTRRPSYVWY